MDFSSSREFPQVPGRKKEAALRPEVTRRRAGQRGGRVLGFHAARGPGAGFSCCGEARRCVLMMQGGPVRGSHAARGTGAQISCCREARRGVSCCEGDLRGSLMLRGGQALGLMLRGGQARGSDAAGRPGVGVSCCGEARHGGLMLRGGPARGLMLRGGVCMSVCCPGASSSTGPPAPVSLISQLGSCG